MAASLPTLLSDNRVDFSELYVVFSDNIKKDLTSRHKSGGRYIGSGLRISVLYDYTF